MTAHVPRSHLVGRVNESISIENALLEHAEAVFKEHGCVGLPTKAAVNLWGAGLPEDDYNRRCVVPSSAPPNFQD